MGSNPHGMGVTFHLKKDCPELKQRQFNQWNRATRQSLNYQNVSMNGAVMQPIVETNPSQVSY